MNRDPGPGGKKERRGQMEEGVVGEEQGRRGFSEGVHGSGISSNSYCTRMENQKK